MDRNGAAAAQTSSTTEVSAQPSTIGHDENEKFVHYALAQRRRIDLILAHAQPRRNWIPIVAQRKAREIRPIWNRDIRDPEFLKNLRIFGRLIDGAIDIHARAMERIPEMGREVEASTDRQTGIPRSASGRSGGSRRGLPHAELDRSLHAGITLPHAIPLTLKVLLGYRFKLEQLLIEVGDQQYVAGRLAGLYDEEKGTHSTWRTLFGDHLPELLAGQVRDGRVTHWTPPKLGQSRAEPEQAVPASASRGDIESFDVDEPDLTRQRLARLMYVKEAEDQVFRVRSELKGRAAELATTVLLTVVIAFTLAVRVMVTDDATLMAAVAAGAAGAGLGGLIKLRDQLSLAAQVRQFLPFLLGQVVVGAAAGLVAFLVGASGFISISEGAGVTLLAFALGFSEAAFLGLLAKLAEIGGESKQ